MAASGRAEPGFSENLAAFAARIDTPAITGDVADALTTRIVDTVGCMLGAARAEPVERVRALEAAYGGRAADGVPGASIVGARGAVPIEAAAFINGIAARYLDFNDIYLSKEAMHPSDNICVALALAEALGRSGAELLLAVARGYEVHCRLADTVSTRKGGWDNVVLGAMAASVMAGSLLQLTQAQQAQAISIAATGNVALMQTRVGALSMWKGIAAAYAARAGLFAALLAQQGITGPNHALDGTHGLFARVTGAPDPAAFEDVRGPLRLLDTHLKAYPSQYFTQTAVDAALALRERVRPAAVKRIEVSTFEFGRVAAADSQDKWHPTTRETADHSMPYCVAVALLDGALGERQFTADRIGAPDAQALLPKIAVVEDPEFTRAYPARVPTRIAVEHEDGTRAQTIVEFPSGHSRNPMSRAQVERKFVDLAGDGKAGALQSLWQIGSWTASQTPQRLRAALA